MATVNSLTNYSSQFMGWDIPVVKEALDVLMMPATALPTPIRLFSKNFSNLPTPSGIINVPVQTWPTSADDLTSGIVVSPATASSAQLKLDKDRGKFFPFIPAEVQQYGMGYALQAWVQPAIYACGRYLASASLAVALNGSNFASASTKFPLSSSFTAIGAAKLNAELSKAGINGERFAGLVSDYFWQLQGQTATLGNQGGANALSSTSVNPYKMTVFEGQDLPSLVSADTANTSSLIGFSGNSAAIAIGTALPPVKHANGDMFPYTSPWTGVTYLVEQYYDESTRKYLIGASFIYDVQKVQNTILRLYSL